MSRKTKIDLITSDNKDFLPNPRILSEFARLELNKVQYLVSSNKSDLDNWREEIKEKGNEQSAGQNFIDQEDILSNEMAYTKEMAELMTKLSVLGTFMVLEDLIKRAIKTVYRNLDEVQRDKKLFNIHRFSFLNKELKLNFEIELIEVKEYPIINELRCLNNVIKHAGGIVDEELAAFPSWETSLKNEIDTIKIVLDKYCTAIPIFIFDLVERINTYLSKTKSK